MRVLIAEDDAPSRLLLCSAVQRLGHECVEAADGDEALARFHETQPEVVITDLDMPGLDGATLVRRIRAAPDVAYAYVMVVTAQSDEARAREAMEAGADDLVIKPIEPADLERQLIAASRVTELHRRLHRDARQDALTGVGNRLRLTEDVAALCGRVDRYGHAYCAALIDVDHFKGYNDGSGHQAGDDVLRAIADALAGTMRSGDTLYRYGGEEFLVLLPEQSIEGATLAAERLRAAVEALGMRHPDGGTVTVSAGVAGLGDRSCTPEQVFEAADKALHRAKQEGRNRVVVERLGEPAGGGEGGVRVLVAVLEDDLRARVAALGEGLEVIASADDAARAVELAGARRPDVVLLDFDMPRGGAYKAAIDIRDAHPQVRIVAISVDESPAAQLDMTRAGAVSYVGKGATDEELLTMIRSASRY